jgi:hypothetical protein
MRQTVGALLQFWRQICMYICWVYCIHLQNVEQNHKDYSILTSLWVLWCKQQEAASKSNKACFPFAWISSQTDLLSYKFVPLLYSYEKLIA